MAKKDNVFTPTDKEDSRSVTSTPGTCGHVNKHWTGEGEMACVLAKGHAGAHEADYEFGPDKEIKRAYWRDEAGMPVSVEG